MNRNLHLVGSTCIVILLPLIAQADTYTSLSRVPGFDNAGESGNFVEMINTVFKISIGIGAAIAVIMIIIAGIRYATSVNASTMQQLRDQMLGAIGGLIFLISATAFLNIINPQITTLKIGEFDKLTSVTGESSSPPTGLSEATGDTEDDTSGKNYITTSLGENTVSDLAEDSLYSVVFDLLDPAAFIDGKSIPDLPGGTGVQSGTPPVDFSRPPSPPSTPAEDAAAVQRNNNDKELRCMAVNMYYEARSQGALGRELVAHATWNRVKAKDFKNTVCIVVYQKKPSVQYSWTAIPGLNNHTPKDKDIMEELTKIAHQVMYKGKKAPAPFNQKCMKYYKRTDNKGASKRGSSWFDRNLYPIGTVEDHTFYCANNGS